MWLALESLVLESDTLHEKLPLYIEHFLEMGKIQVALQICLEPMKYTA